MQLSTLPEWLTDRLTLPERTRASPQAMSRRPRAAPRRTITFQRRLDLLQQIADLLDRIIAIVEEDPQDPVGCLRSKSIPSFAARDETEMRYSLWGLYRGRDFCRILLRLLQDNVLPQLSDPEVSGEPDVSLTVVELHG